MIPQSGKVLVKGTSVSPWRGWAFCLAFLALAGFILRFSQSNSLSLPIPLTHFFVNLFLRQRSFLPHRPDVSCLTGPLFEYRLSFDPVLTCRLHTNSQSFGDACSSLNQNFLGSTSDIAAIDTPSTVCPAPENPQLSVSWQ